MARSPSADGKAAGARSGAGSRRHEQSRRHGDAAGRRGHSSGGSLPLCRSARAILSASMWTARKRCAEDRTGSGRAILHLSDGRCRHHGRSRLADPRCRRAGADFPRQFLTLHRQQGDQRSRRSCRQPALVSAPSPFVRRASGGRATPSAETSRTRSGRASFAFIARGDYPYSTCHVDNVVEALICALDRGEGGRAYFVRDPDNTTFRAFIDGLAKLQGLSIDTLRSVPYGTAFFMGRMMELGARLRRSDQDPALTRTMVRMIGREFTIDDSAARRDLGYVGKISRLEGLASYGAG